VASQPALPRGHKIGVNILWKYNNMFKKLLCIILFKTLQIVFYTYTIIGVLHYRENLISSQKIQNFNIS